MTAVSPTTSDDAKFYQQNGYIRYEHFFSPAEIATLREAIDHAIQQVDRFRGYLGATENRIDSALATILEQKNAVVAARSR